MSNQYEDMSYRRICGLIAEQIKTIQEAVSLLEEISDGSGVDCELDIFGSRQKHTAGQGWEEDTEWDSSSC